MGDFVSIVEEAEADEKIKKIKEINSGFYVIDTKYLKKYIYKIKPSEEIMGAYLMNQEFNNLRWGTMMPIMVMVNSEVLQLRARGSYSLAVTDPKKLEEHIPEPDGVGNWVSSQVVVILSDIIGEAALNASSPEQLLGGSKTVEKSLKSNLDVEMLTLGLRLKTFSLEALEKV